MVTEKQLKNLEKGRKTRFRTGEAQVKIAKMGAEASNRVQAEKRNLRQCAEIFGSMPDIKTEEELKSQGIDVDGVTQNMGVIFGLYKSAKKGNSNAARVLAELVGELKQQQTNVTVNNNPYADLSDETLKKLAEED